MDMNVRNEVEREEFQVDKGDLIMGVFFLFLIPTLFFFLGSVIYAGPTSEERLAAKEKAAAMNQADAIPMTRAEFKKRFEHYDHMLSVVIDEYIDRAKSAPDNIKKSFWSMCAHSCASECKAQLENLKESNDRTKVLSAAKAQALSILIDKAGQLYAFAKDLDPATVILDGVKKKEDPDN